MTTDAESDWRSSMKRTVCAKEAIPRGLMMQRRFVTLLRTGTVLLSAACFSIQAATPLNACDLNSDGVVNTADVDLAISMSTGAVTPCTANIIGSGVCNVVMVQRVINASQGASCGRTATLTWTASVSAGVTGYKVTAVQSMVVPTRY